MEYTAKYRTKITQIAILFIVLFFGMSLDVYAEGSKDLYPAGAYGGRAVLFSGNSPQIYFPFPTLGEHFVYAREGETIAIASSTQSTGSERIKLYGIDGVEIELDYSSGGLISNRAEELAGPILPGATANPNEYSAIYYEVPTGKSGVYKVEFTPYGNAENSGRQRKLKADDNWTQPDGSSPYIVAWDVSVANTAKDGWENGRVYTNVLTMDIPTNPSGNTNFYGNEYNFFGEFKVLTKDGYTYNVDNNGNNGYAFSFMANNKGFYDTDPIVPSYESKTISSISHITNHYHDPRSADTGTIVTYKIFYNTPDSTMPATSVGSVPGGETWLISEKVNLQVDEIKFEGVEGTEGQAGIKGGYFIFESEQNLMYVIKIKNPNNLYTERVLTGIATASGENKVFWDGKDGSGNPLDVGEHIINVELKLKGAEVHFPYIDMEINPNGIIIEALDEDGEMISDHVYWDDTNIERPTETFPNGRPDPINASHLVLPDGISSSINGHKWGAHNGKVIGEFGDDQAIDTWAFTEGESATDSFNIEVLEADLLIQSITSDQDGNCVEEGTEITYTVVVRNDGPSDVEDAPFSFILPEGVFTHVSASFDGNSCGTERETISFDTAENQYSSVLDLPNGCEVTYTIKVKVYTTLNGEKSEVIATILRPNDVTDPDATNPNTNTKPFDPFDECENNGLGGDCNNIMKYNAVTLNCCYYPGTFDSNLTIPTQVGISSLRNDNTNGWPQVRESAWIALESKTKGFVPNRLTSGQIENIPSKDLVEGMMVYNITEDCLQINIDGTTSGWKCFNNQSCQEK